MLTSGNKMPATAIIAHRLWTSSACWYLLNNRLSHLPLVSWQHAQSFTACITQATVCLLGMIDTRAPFQRCWVAAQGQRVEAEVSGGVSEVAVLLCSRKCTHWNE
jgi:hypothetical protein